MAERFQPHSRIACHIFSHDTRRPICGVVIEHTTRNLLRDFASTIELAGCLLLMRAESAPKCIGVTGQGQVVLMRKKAAFDTPIDSPEQSTRIAANTNARSARISSVIISVLRLKPLAAPFGLKARNRHTALPHRHVRAKGKEIFPDCAVALQPEHSCCGELAREKLRPYLRSSRISSARVS